MDDIKQARILIVDDQSYNMSLLERILTRAGFAQIETMSDGSLVTPWVRENDPDIVLLDLHMPGMDGIEVLHHMRQQRQSDLYLPVLMLTADTTAESKQLGLQAGASDFLTKPFDRSEVILRMTNLLKTRMLHLQLHRQNQTLEERVQQRTEELQLAKLEVLHLLGRASEYRDDLTGQHTQRVGWLSGRIAEQLGLDEQEAEMIRQAAPLHDIGKIGIPDALLLKPGRFEADEFERMKAHTWIGARILEDSSFPMLQLAGMIARSHHERWDGTGYPERLSGEQIPLAARIVALADFYDALTHDRPYKAAWSPEETIAEVKRQRGKHFDPAIVDVFVALYDRNEVTMEEQDDAGTPTADMFAQAHAT